MAGTDFSHLTSEELINGIQALNIPDYIREKAYGVDVRETLAQMTEMLMQLAYNQGMDPQQAKDWVSQLNNKIVKGQVTMSDLTQEVKEALTGGAVAVVGVGAVGTENIKDKTVTPDKTTFLEKTKNLFNKETVFLDSYLNNLTGALMPGVNYFASDWIAVRPGETIVFPTTNLGLMCQLYTSESNTPVEQRKMGEDATEHTITLASNITRIRVWAHIGLLESLQIEYGTISTPYEPFGSYIPNNIIRDNTIEINKLKLDSAKLLEMPSEMVNLYDKTKNTLSKYVNRTNGTLVDLATYDSTDFIPVMSGSKIYMTNVATGAFFSDKSQSSFVDGIAFSSPQPISVPEKAKYVKMSVSKSEVDAFQLVNADTMPYQNLPYFENMAEYLLSDNLPVMPSGTFRTPSEIFGKILKEKSSPIIEFWGDSRMHGMGATGYDSTANGGGIQILAGTQGVYTSPNADSFVNKFSNLMSTKYNATVRNWSEAGKNTNHYLSRYATLLSQSVLPDIIFIGLGTNDRHNMTTVETTKANWRTMINAIKAKGIEVILVSMPPTTIAEQNQEAKNFSMYDLDKAAKAVSAEYEQERVNLYQYFLDYQEVHELAEDALSIDGLHENPLGHKVEFQGLTKQLGLSYIKEGSY